MAPPVITANSPASGSEIATDDGIYVEVYENGTAIARDILSVEFPGMLLTEVAWDGSAFTESYRGLSTRIAVVHGTYGNGFGYTLRRAPIWPDGPTLHTFAIGTGGELADNTAVYSLEAGAPAPEPTVVPTFSATAGPGPTECDGVAHDAAYYLRLIDNILPSWYLDPLKLYTDSGYEVFRAVAAVAERISLAIERFECGNLAMYADSGAFATGTVEFQRPTDAAGAVTVGAGTILRCSKSGRRFVTTTDAVFGASDLGPIAASARSLHKSYQYNALGRVITPVSAITLEGDVDTVEKMVQLDTSGARTFIDNTITVTNILPFTNGKAAMLDAVGFDRGITRARNEPDNQYRYRVRTLPDTISPDAIERFLETVFDLYGLTYDFIETFEPAYQTCWDYPSDQAGTPTYYGGALPAWLSPYESIFCYDWPAPTVPMRNRWLDDVEYRAAFIVGVPNLAHLEDVGMAYDDTAMNAAGHSYTQGEVVGRRAYAAFDVPATFSFGVQGGYDGFDLPKQQFYKTLFDNIAAIRAAGVASVMELRGE
jgi:hypothetical protein